MGLLRNLRSRLRRRPVDPERVLARARADAYRRTREQHFGPSGSGGGGPGDGGF